MIRYMDEHPECAACQPKLLALIPPETHNTNPSTLNYFEYAGAAGGYLDKYGYPFCRGRVMNTIEKDEGQYDETVPLLWGTGAALMVRATDWQASGGLDNRFFAHMEEIDLCWRIRNAGYRIVVEPRSVVYHVGGGTLPKNNSFKTFLNFRNNHFLLIKNLPARRLFPTFWARLFLDNLAAFVFLLQRHGRDFLAVYKAQFAVLSQYRKMKAKRKGMSFEAYKDVCHTSILFQYHIKRKHRFDGQSFH